jgi:4-amino-4-deoxy-L-arabinose transferase-like glycosyltransferase
MDKSLRASAQLLLWLIAIALLLRSWGIGFGLPFTYHPDEHQYVDSALGFFKGDLNPHRFNNPALYKYMLFLEYGLLYLVGRCAGLFRSVAEFEALWHTDPTIFYLLGRLTGAVFGTATIPLTYLIGKYTYGRRSGLLASCFLAFTFLHARDSHYAVNDVPMTFLAMASILCSVLMHQRGSTRYYLLAGLFIGLATATKYVAALATIPFLLAHFLSHPSGLRDIPAKLISSKLIKGFTALGAAYLIASPYSLLDSQAFMEDIRLLSLRGAMGFKGLQLADVSGWVFYLRTLNWGMGYGLLLISIIGLLFAVCRHTKEDLLLISFPLALYLFLGRQVMFFARFIIPALPILVLLAARVLLLAISRMPLLGQAKNYVLVIAVVAALLQPTCSIIRHNYLLTRKDTRTIAKDWIEENIPSGAKIIVEQYTPELSGGMYDLTVVGTMGLPSHRVEYYRKEQFEYVIISSFCYDRTLLDKGKDEARRSFYQSLDAEADLIKVFKPYSGQTKPPFIFAQIYGPATALWRFERPGPVIKIYRLR